MLLAEDFFDIQKHRYINKHFTCKCLLKQNQLNTTHRILTSDAQMFQLNGVIALQGRKIIIYLESCNLLASQVSILNF